MSESLQALEARLDEAMLRLLRPLRMSKTVDSVAASDILVFVAELEAALGESSQVPRKLVGKMWLLHILVLAEADHARDPDPILDFAAEYAELVRRVLYGRF
jgi:hypothetical protein